MRAHCDLVEPCCTDARALQRSDEGAECDSADEEREEELRQRMDLHQMIAERGRGESEAPAVSADEVISEIDSIIEVGRRLSVRPLSVTRCRRTISSAP